MGLLKSDERTDSQTGNRIYTANTGASSTFIIHLRIHCTTVCWYCGVTVSVSNAVLLTISSTTGLLGVHICVRVRRCCCCCGRCFDIWLLRRLLSVLLHICHSGCVSWTKWAGEFAVRTSNTPTIISFQRRSGRWRLNQAQEPTLDCAAEGTRSRMELKLNVNLDSTSLKLKPKPKLRPKLEVKLSQVCVCAFDFSLLPCSSFVPPSKERRQDLAWKRAAVVAQSCLCASFVTSAASLSLLLLLPPRKLNRKRERERRKNRMASFVSAILIFPSSFIKNPLRARLWYIPAAKAWNRSFDQQQRPLTRKRLNWYVAI